MIDADAKRHVFAEAGDGPHIFMRPTDKTHYRKFAFNPELSVSEAYAGGRPSFDGNGLGDQSS